MHCFHFVQWTIKGWFQSTVEQTGHCIFLGSSFSSPSFFYCLSWFINLSLNWMSSDTLGGGWPTQSGRDQSSNNYLILSLLLGRKKMKWTHPREQLKGFCNKEKIHPKAQITAITACSINQYNMNKSLQIKRANLWYYHKHISTQNASGKTSLAWVVVFTKPCCFWFAVNGTPARFASVAFVVPGRRKESVFMFTFMFKFEQDRNMQILFWGGFPIWVTTLCNYAIKTLLLNWKGNWRGKDLKSHVGNSRQSHHVSGDAETNSTWLSPHIPQYFLCFAKTGPKCTDDVRLHFHYSRGSFWVHSFFICGTECKAQPQLPFMISSLISNKGLKIFFKVWTELLNGNETLCRWNLIASPKLVYSM